MRQKLIHAGSLVTFVLLLGGCTAATSVFIDNTFPPVNAYPRDVKATVVIDEAFSSYKAVPTTKITIDLGNAQVELMRSAFRGLFSQVEFVSNREAAAVDTQLLITPHVQEVQVTTPSETYLNVYEVWIKYNLEIENPASSDTNNWFMPAYGKTTDSFMMSKVQAIKSATNIALRDAGAKLLLDFYRIPSVNAWYQQFQLERQQQMVAEP